MLPVLTALLGLLGGGIVRALLDRRAEVKRVVGYARAVREELQDAGRRLADGGPHRLPTSTWETHHADLAGALLEEEYMFLGRVYRAMGDYNAGLDAKRGKRLRARAVDETVRMDHQIASSLVTQGLSAIAWLARGDVTLFGRRRAQLVFDAHPGLRCKCGHTWDHHRWEQFRRRRLRIRNRDLTARVVAHECNVASCRCTWFREEGRRHLPRRVQRLGVGLQSRPLGHSVEPDAEPHYDPSIPPTAQPGAVIEIQDAT